MDAAVGRDDLRPLRVQGSALEIRDSPAGLLDHEHSRGRVPRADPQFPVTVEPPRRHVAEVEHRGAHASHALTAQAERGELGQVVARRLPDVVGEPRGHQALVQRGRLRHGQALAVPAGAPPAPGHEAFVEVGIVHHPEPRLAIHLEGDGDAEDGDAVGVVGGAVQRIDDPAAAGRPTQGPALLGENGVPGKSCLNRLDDQRLGAAIHLGDQVGRAPLEGDLAALSQLGAEERPGAPGGVNRDLLVPVVHGGSEFLGYHESRLDSQAAR